MQIIIGLFVLYVAAISLFLGFSLDKILTKGFPEKNVIEIFSGFLLYYFFFDIIFRFLMQDLPTLAVLPYLIQNIRRRKLIKFLNVRSLFSIFNILPIFLFVPFISTVINAKYGNLVSFSMIVAIIGVALFNHFLVLFVKRKTTLSQWWLIGFFVVLLLAIAADHYQIFSLRNWSSGLFGLVLNIPALCIIFLVLALAAWYNNSIFLRKNFYLEDLEKSSKERKSANYGWLQRFGVYGDLAGVDIKLILRNKRPLMLVVLSVILLFYGYVFFTPENFKDDNLGLMLFGAIFITGIFMINFGQFLFAWQSRHFDGLMAANIDIKTYIKID